MTGASAVRTVVFAGGLGSSARAWDAVLEVLSARFHAVTFDYPAHGVAPRGHDQSFAAMSAALDAVLLGVEARPLLVGWSMGADVVLRHAAAHPGTIAGVLNIDGALPIAHVIEDPVALQRMLSSRSARLARRRMRKRGLGSRLTSSELATLNLQIQEGRDGILEVYDALDCPLEVLVSTKAGPGAFAERFSRLAWEAATRLEVARPAIPLKRLDTTHAIPFEAPDEVVAAIERLDRRA
jgi:pimeloyl-ACP methyl ester carboxylesterase